MPSPDHPITRSPDARLEREWRARDSRRRAFCSDGDDVARRRPLEVEGPFRAGAGERSEKPDANRRGEREAHLGKRHGDAEAARLEVRLFQGPIGEESVPPPIALGLDIVGFGGRAVAAYELRIEHRALQILDVDADVAA